LSPDGSNDSAPLAVTGLSFRYGERVALDEVSLSAEAGRFTALLGPNGAGKSTLFSLLTRLLISRQGQIRIAGHDLEREPRAALAALGVVFQDATLDLDLTVAQNLRYFSRLHGLPPRQAEQRAEEELTRLGLWERRNEKVRALNGGHRRRVEIARALLHRPAVLILDEPTVGLDPPTRRLLVDHIHQLCATTGMAVLWATHLIDEVDPASDRVVILHRGRIRAAGDVPVVLAAAHSDSLADAFRHFTPESPPAQEAR